MHFRTVLKEHELFQSWNFYSHLFWVARKLLISTASYLESAVHFDAARYKKHATVTRTLEWSLLQTVWASIMTYLCKAYRKYLFPFIHFFHTKLLQFVLTRFYLFVNIKADICFHTPIIFRETARRVYLTSLAVVDGRWMKYEYGAMVKWYWRREKRSTRRKPLFSDTFSITYCTCTGMELLTFRIYFCSLWRHFIFSNSKLFSRVFKCTAEYSVRIFIINIRIFPFTILICTHT
jgi:hypothetical protein